MSATSDSNARAQREIESLEQREARAMRDGDVATLQALWADDLIVNSTSNLIAGKQILLELIKSGRLKLPNYQRRPVRIVTLGDLTVTTGNEVSRLVADSAGSELFVSYMNVWTKREGNWRLLARHVGLIERRRI